MVNLKETAQQFVLSSIFGLISTVLTILLSNLLDHYMNHSISNFIGLSVDAVLDFSMMKKIFKVQEESHTFIVRYIIAIAIRTVTAQLLYMGFHAYMDKYHPEWFKKNWDKDSFWIRYVIGAVSYAFVEFPLQKFWVFKK